MLCCVLYLSPFKVLCCVFAILRLLRPECRSAQNHKCLPLPKYHIASSSTMSREKDDNTDQTWPSWTRSMTWNENDNRGNDDAVDEKEKQQVSQRGTRGHRGWGRAGRQTLLLGRIFHEQCNTIIANTNTHICIQIQIHSNLLNLSFVLNVKSKEYNVWCAMYNVLLRSCRRGECNRGWEGERERSD